MILTGRKRIFLAAIIVCCTAHDSSSQDGELLSPDELKKLSLEELMNIKVTSVSRRPEKLTEVASAIQVITREDILRSGATNLPEALRLAPNLQVAQLNSSAWIISARGFNAIFSNKLLVMIDGRTVYSPLFAGVFWDVQNVLLEDVERIEVVSGPGGTLWGANAVNGVINIITKSASETPGLYVSAGTGNFLKQHAAVRYGGKIGEEFSWRIYGMGSEREHTFLQDGGPNNDAWYMLRSGFSADWNPSETDALLMHGNIYTGTHENVPYESDIDGQNMLARWSHHFSEKSYLTVQGYYDRTWRRDIPSTISDQTQTYDLDFDHRFFAGKQHQIVWGGGYRIIDSKTQHSTPFVGFVPAQRDMNLFSGFIQDEISLFDEQVKIILGAKVQHNAFSEFDIQPNARLAWTGSQSTVWGAVSRAVRAPSRIDVDYFIPTYDVPPPLPSVAGGPNFISEKVVAYEVGYRLQAGDNTFVSIAGFYNRYQDLYSVDSLRDTRTYQIQNNTEGTSRGLEFSGRASIGRNWHIRGGYTYFYKDLRNKPGSIYDFSALGNDAENRFLVHSMLDLPGNFQFDVSFRYVDPLPNPHIPDYLTFDARLAWVYKSWEISVKGQNLWEDRHREYIALLPRTIYGNIICRF